MGYPTTTAGPRQTTFKLNPNAKEFKLNPNAKEFVFKKEL